MPGPAPAAGYETHPRPFAGDWLEVRATLSQGKPVSLPVPVKCNYRTLIVSAVPALTILGARGGGITLPTLDDVDVSIETRDQRYRFGERYDEGTTNAPNQRLVLRAFEADNTLLRMELGNQTGLTELVVTFGWRDPATAVAASYASVLASLTFGLQRLDAGSANG